MEDETRQKLIMEERVRQVEESADSLQDALEKEQKAKKALETALETKNNTLSVIDFSISAFLYFLIILYSFM